MLNTAQQESLKESYKGYVQNPIERESQVIEGYFYKESTVKDMAIRKVNKSLCGLLIVAIMTAFISYYFVMCSQLTLDNLRNQIVALNDENFDLQNDLDRLKSFNNVDNKMEQFNLLQKADKVIEVQAIPVSSKTASKKTAPAKIASSEPFRWAIGY